MAKRQTLLQRLQGGETEESLKKKYKPSSIAREAWTLRQMQQRGSSDFQDSEAAGLKGMRNEIERLKLSRELAKERGNNGNLPALAGDMVALEHRIISLEHRLVAVDSFFRALGFLQVPAQGECPRGHRGVIWLSAKCQCGEGMLIPLIPLGQMLSQLLSQASPPGFQDSFPSPYQTFKSPI